MSIHSQTGEGVAVVCVVAMVEALVQTDEVCLGGLPSG